MEPSARTFEKNAKRALEDEDLQRALAHVRSNFIGKRAKARANLPEFDALRDQGRDLRNHTLAHMDLYLEAYEAAVQKSGGVVHWAKDAGQARDIVRDICEGVGARLVTKSKSMISEEIALNAHLESAGMEVVETDLGEYIIQLRQETPSHIIAPAVHLTRDQVEADFRRAHAELPATRDLSDPSDLVGEARKILREKFLSADVGITGANFLVAETGTSIIVTNEGNGDLTQILPETHIVLASLEKVVPTLEDATTLLRLLARSATGQELSNYTTFSTGPRRDPDLDGPKAYHVILLDNGRSAMLADEFREVLRCIRCGACMNHCPVYHAVGGHAYGWVYPGPIGAVLTPSLIGVEEAAKLPNASTFCGRCESVCPMRIPLPKLMRRHRERAFERGQLGVTQRMALAGWGWLAARPALYRHFVGALVRMLAFTGRRRGAFRWLPFAGGWTKYRDLPAPTGRTFQQQWRRRMKKRS